MKNITMKDLDIIKVINWLLKLNIPDNDLLQTLTNDEIYIAIHITPKIFIGMLL